MDLLLTSMVVACGASAVAVLLAALAVLATFGRNSSVARWQCGLISSLILLPSYVVAGAWSAGFGSMGWWTLSQVTAAKAPLVGIGSVIWIHAMAATPIAFWLLTIGMRRCPSSSIELAVLEGGWRRHFSNGIWPTWSIWIASTFCLIAASVSGEMVITNLFQVTTLTERCYLDAMADESSWRPWLSSAALSAGLSFLGVLIYRSFSRKHHPQRQPSEENRLPLGSDRLASVVGAMAILLLVAVPIANLVIKAGWVAREASGGVVTRAWSLAVMMQNVAKVPVSYAEEFQWSLSLATWSTTIAILVAALAIFFPRRASLHLFQPRSHIDSMLAAWRGIALGLLMAIFSIPGPIVSSIVFGVFQLQIPGLAWLYDHTLAAPILCMQFRLLPIAIVILAIVDQQWQNRSGTLWQLDADRPWWYRLQVYLKATGRSFITLWIVLFAVAFGDLSSYLPCLPPGVMPVSMRIFDLLHYGVRSSEAGLLLFLVGTGSVLGWICFRNQASSR